ncbi:hypothetical protein KAFR_0B02090 [Kazachstania africana CBS 2517]|uniref:Uncharacterized protein n=1 Tax=Kazachstania africana (strain ATCC 22294 / BCRC 22015 / CBS 2517 / CECT 1963 / NBRC 1671 / NRRL Y-8276) TaxID=1071382 RepID=H2AQ57_KAZAF|nr:hypothetical protein KAFR_0B02090 [Kazachstania africana CBS 2517]CCF56507.1 hypothetical protein KAFR_0B02090 [Kazachstania africana CBS 2517]
MFELRMLVSLCQHRQVIMYSMSTFNFFQFVCLHFQSFRKQSQAKNKQTTVPFLARLQELSRGLKKMKDVAMQLHIYIYTYAYKGTRTFPHGPHSHDSTCHLSKQHTTLKVCVIKFIRRGKIWAEKDAAGTGKSIHSLWTVGVLQGTSLPPPSQTHTTPSHIYLAYTYTIHPSIHPSDVAFSSDSISHHIFTNLSCTI